MADEGIPFKKGDAVQHKTGGPKMIFIGPGPSTGVMCSWMANGRKQIEQFEVEELEPFVPREPTIMVV